VKRILLAEDDPQLLEIMEELLADEGFQVDTAADGAAALEMARTRAPYDVLLLDHEMPRLNGCQVLEQLAGTLPPGTAVILLTGALELGPAERTRLGITEILSKPASIDQILQTLRGRAHEG
jgi:CheY-like chemotaxis protein